MSKPQKENGKSTSCYNISSIRKEKMQDSKHFCKNVEYSNNYQQSNTTPETVDIYSSKVHRSSNDYSYISLASVGGSLVQDVRKIYKIKEVIGGGHFGTVRIGFKRNQEPKKLYAIKSIYKKPLSQKDLYCLIKEVEILSYLDHPNIIHFYETYHDEYYFHIVMELCKGKELFNIIANEGKIYERRAMTIIAKVLSAISYCHSKGITHRDLKPENILFENEDNEEEIKLIDFGLSRKFDTNEKMHTIIGSPYYVAPEVLTGDYDNKCDIWSIGALTYVMLCGEAPFSSCTNVGIFKKILKEEVKFEQDIWKDISKNAIDFIRNCLTKHPKKRFSGAVALLHPWFTHFLKDVHSEENLSSDILNTLKSFSSTQKFKKIVLRYLVGMLCKSDIKKLNNAFYAIDTDHTGHINRDELSNAFKLAGIEISIEDIQKIIYAADERNDGKLDYSEFVVACLNQKKQIDKDKLMSAFKYFDFDSSGDIDATDLRKSLLRSGKKILNVWELNKMIAEVAQKKNEMKISIEDFMKLFEFFE